MGAGGGERLQCVEGEVGGAGEVVSGARVMLKGAAEEPRRARGRQRHEAVERVPVRQPDRAHTIHVDDKDENSICGSRKAECNSFVSSAL